MILETKKLQEACKKILVALDKSSTDDMSEKLELLTKDNTLTMSITNSDDYFVKLNIGLESEVEEIDLIVSAKLFLGLISKTTTHDVDLTISENTLIVKGNGAYKLPVETSNKLNEIVVENITSTTTISGKVLLSVLNHNSKNLVKDTTKQVEKMFYFDNDGCITYTTTTGACVNPFKFDTSAKILLNEKVVNLFKLFKSDDEIGFKLGFSQVGDVIQQRLSLETNEVKIYIKTLSDQSMISQIPSVQLRALASEIYPSNVVVDKSSLLNAITRITPFIDYGSTFKQSVAKFIMGVDGITLSDVKGDNEEIVKFFNSTGTSDEKYVNLNTLKQILSSCQDEYFTMSYGKGHAIIITTTNGIKHIIPTLRK